MWKGSVFIIILLLSCIHILFLTFVKKKKMQASKGASSYVCAVTGPKKETAVGICIDGTTTVNSLPGFSSVVIPTTTTAVKATTAAATTKTGASSAAYSSVHVFGLAGFEFLKVLGTLLLVVTVACLL
jgi:hypothetical protein